MYRQYFKVIITILSKVKERDVNPDTGAIWDNKQLNSSHIAIKTPNKNEERKSILEAAKEKR